MVFPNALKFKSTTNILFKKQSIEEQTFTIVIVPTVFCSIVLVRKCNLFFCKNALM